MYDLIYCDPPWSYDNKTIRGDEAPHNSVALRRSEYVKQDGRESGFFTHQGWGKYE